MHMGVEKDIDAELRRLEATIGSLLDRFGALQEENRLLRTELELSTRERTRLIEKNTIARDRLAAMISQLRSLGHDA